MSAHAAPLHHTGHTTSLNRTALLATLHCLTGCAIGEVLGMVIGTWLGLGNPATIALAVVLAFVFGYSLTMLPLLRAGLTFAVALPLAFASDSLSIAVMELVDNGVLLAIPGAMDAPLTNPLFWGSLAFALAVAFVVAYPVNRTLIGRGLGHAVVHSYHGQGTVHGEATDAEGGSPAEPANDAGSSRRFILLGLAAMAVTITVATAGALVVESHGAPTTDHPPTEPQTAGHTEGTGR